MKLKNLIKKFGENLARKYEKWPKYKFKPENVEFGGPTKARKGPRKNLPRATTYFYVQEYRDINLNTKLGQIKT